MGEQVNAWRQRTDQPPMIVPNSSLGKECTAFPAMPVTSLAWQAILSAVDHLEMFHATLVATGKVFVYGYYTLARSAGICAARALWVLDAPTRDERIRRGLIMALNEHRQELATLKEMRGLGDEPEALAKRITTSEDRIKEVIEAAKQLGLGDISECRVVDTGILPEVLARIPAKDAASRTAAFTVNWRISGGTAHGQLWPGLLRTTETMTIDGQHYARVTAGGLEALEMIAAAAHSLTARAIELFGLRAQAAS